MQNHNLCKVYSKISPFKTQRSHKAIPCLKTYINYYLCDLSGCLWLGDTQGAIIKVVTRTVPIYILDQGTRCSSEFTHTVCFGHRQKSLPHWAFPAQRAWFSSNMAELVGEGATGIPYTILLKIKLLWSLCKPVFKTESGEVSSEVLEVRRR